LRNVGVETIAIFKDKNGKDQEMRWISEERLIYWFDLFVAKKRLNELDVIRTLIYECKELNQWQTIDGNTPKDRPILLFYPQHYGGCFQGYWVNGRFTCDIDSLYDDEPTHWQELPEPPK